MGKVCLVAGVGEHGIGDHTARHGIGDHTARKFASEGYAVAMLARRKENLDRLEGEIPGARGFQCDVSQIDQLQKAVERVTAELGPIDVLIVNTSAGPFKPFSDTSQEEFDLAMATGVRWARVCATLNDVLLSAARRGSYAVDPWAGNTARAS